MRGLGVGGVADGELKIGKAKRERFVAGREGLCVPEVDQGGGEIFFLRGHLSGHLKIASVACGRGEGRENRLGQIGMPEAERRAGVGQRAGRITRPSRGHLAPGSERFLAPVCVSQLRDHGESLEVIGIEQEQLSRSHGRTGEIVLPGELLNLPAKLTLPELSVAVPAGETEQRDCGGHAGPPSASAQPFPALQVAHAGVALVHERTRRSIQSKVATAECAVQQKQPRETKSRWMIMSTWRFRAAGGARCWLPGLRQPQTG